MLFNLNLYNYPIELKASRALPAVSVEQQNSDSRPLKLTVRAIGMARPLDPFAPIVNLNGRPASRLN